MQRHRLFAKEEPIGVYSQTWARSLRAREQGDEAIEDALLEQLGDIWLLMTPIQIATINTLAQALVDQVVSDARDQSKQRLDMAKTAVEQAIEAGEATEQFG